MQQTRAFAAAHPLGEQHPHMQTWNGGITAEQMGWLTAELAAAVAAGDRVIVVGS
jgi:hypothetical protein